MTLVLDLRFIPPPPPLEVQWGEPFSWFGYVMLALLLSSALSFTYIAINFTLRSSASIEEYINRTYRPRTQAFALVGIMFLGLAGGWIDNQVQIKIIDGKKKTHYAAEREIIDKIEPALEEYYGVDIATIGLPQTPSDGGRISLRHEGQPNEGCDLNVVNNEYRIFCDSSNLELELATELTPRD